MNVSILRSTLLTKSFASCSLFFTTMIGDLLTNCSLSLTTMIGDSLSSCALFLTTMIGDSNAKSKQWCEIDKTSLEGSQLQVLTSKFDSS